MTETLTYDPTPADTPELNADEQKSLEVAEKLGEEEAKQYAGKFQNAEDLENAYLELQKKLGDKDDDTEPTTKAEDEAANGYEGRMLTGKAPRTSEAFLSQAEVVQAMTDPRYERDPAYRQDVYDKLERSNVQF